MGRCDRQRMAHKSSGEESDPRLWEGLVAVLPEAAVESVHERTASGYNADRQAATNYLAVRSEVGFNTKVGLSPSGCAAKPCNYFVEYQHDFVVPGDSSQFVEKLTRLKLWSATLDRLHDHGGDLTGVLLDE